MADEYGDTISSELDRLERVLAGKESELQRLKTELALKTLYVDELQATLDSQSRELEAFDLRLRQMEGRIARTLLDEPPREPAKPVKPVPLLIRIRKGTVE